MLPKLKLYTTVCGKWNYVGLNQILKWWDQHDLIERIQIKKGTDKRRISWVEKIGTLALEPSDVFRIKSPFEHVLGCQYAAPWIPYPNIHPWNFYPRDWASYKKVQQNMPASRPIESIFSGTVNNHGYKKDRKSWRDVTEVFSMYKSHGTLTPTRLYATMEQYYTALASAKYGLCLVGDWHVCQREIETMGLGCVPIFTPGVQWHYAVEPEENVHFLYANTPEEMKSKIEGTPESHWKAMSQAGIEYFNKYCSPRGLWNTVERKFEEYYGT